MTDAQRLIDQLWDFPNPPLSEGRFRAARAESSAVGDHARALELATQIARAQGLQRRFGDAHDTLDKVERELGGRLEEDVCAAARVRLSLERGRVFNSSGDKAKAAPLFARAFAAAQQLGDDHLAVDAAHMMAIAAQGPAAMEWNLRALAVAEASTQPRARQWLASLHNNMGWTLHDQGDFAQALDHFEQALRMRQQQEGKPREMRIARWCIGRCLRSLGRIAEALAVQEDLRSQWEQSGETDDGYVFEELGECLLALDLPDQAAPQFARAYELLSADAGLAALQPERLSRLHRLSGGNPAKSADPITRPLSNDSL